MNIIENLRLSRLKRRLKVFEKSAKQFEEKGVYDDFFHIKGIPDVEKKIKEMESKEDKNE